MPLVSVITPCYNAERFIAQTLQSVSSQTLKEIEHILINDGSPDHSAAVIRETWELSPGDCSLKRVLISQKHAGVARARNNGYKTASPESRYLLFLDADDCLEPDMLAKMTAHAEKHPEAGLVHCDYQFIDEQANPVDIKEDKPRYAPEGRWVRTLKPQETETPFVSIFALAPLIPSVTLVRRSAYEKTSGWDETFGHHREDVDLFFRIAIQSKVHFIPGKLVKRRRHSHQNTADSSRRDFFIAQDRKLYEKWKKMEGLTPEQMKTVREAFRFKEGRLESYLAFRRAGDYLRNGKPLLALRFYAGGTRRYLSSFF